jgi:hypothetical protein
MRFHFYNVNGWSKNEAYQNYPFAEEKNDSHSILGMPLFGQTLKPKNE